MDERESNPWFKKEISLGSLLTIGMIIASTTYWGAHLEGRVNQNESELRAAQTLNDIKFDNLEKQQQQQREDFKASLNSIQKGIDRIESKLDRKVDKP